MDFFQGLGKKVSDAAKTVTKRTSEVAEVARMNGKIGQKTDEMEELFAQIGKTYYAMRESGGQDAAIAVMATRIDAIRAEIAELTQAVDAIRQVVRCPNCDEPQPEDASFCAQCGTKLIKPKKPPVAPAPVDDDMKPPQEEIATPEFTINWPEAAASEAPQDDPEAKPTHSDNWEPDEIE